MRTRTLAAAPIGPRRRARGLWRWRRWRHVAAGQDRQRLGGCALARRALSRRSLSLEIDPSLDPVAGWLSDEHGERSRFTGWLGLAIRLELVIDDTAANAAENPGE